MIVLLNCDYCGLNRQLTKEEVKAGEVSALCPTCSSKITVKRIEYVDTYKPRVDTDKEEHLDTYAGALPFPKAKVSKETQVDKEVNTVEDYSQDTNYGFRDEDDDPWANLAY